MLSLTFAFSYILFVSCKNAIFHFEEITTKFIGKWELFSIILSIKYWKIFEELFIFFLVFDKYLDERMNFLGLHEILILYLIHNSILGTQSSIWNGIFQNFLRCFQESSINLLKIKIARNLRGELNVYRCPKFDTRENISSKNFLYYCWSQWSIFIHSLNCFYSKKLKIFKIFSTISKIV